MELNFGMFPILSTFFVLVLMILKLFKQSKPKLPPGPWKLPIIGSVHHLSGSLLHHRLKDLADKHGPLMHLQLGELSLFVVSSSEIAKEVMKTQDANFANRPFHLAASIVGYDGSGITFSPYGECWRQLRKICNLELLSSKQVQSLRLVREEEVSKFVKSISQNPGSPVNLSKSLSSLIYGITAKAAFGKKCKEQDAFISLVNDSVTVGGGFSLADLFPSSKLLAFLSSTRAELEKIHQGFDQILNDIIEEHKISEISEGEVEKDLVDVLLHVQKRGDLDIPLSTDNIKAVILEVFSAGSESSSTTIEWAMSELLKNPHIMEKAQAEVRQVFDRRGSFDEIGVRELEFLLLVIKETLRLHNPGPLGLPRENSEKCELNGFEIPEKSRVIINAWAINRDPNTWDDPESFHPERFRNSTLDYRGLDFKYTPFGAGRRICPGISFGLANIELPLASLLYHFDWKLADGIDSKDLDMAEVFGLTVGRKNDLVAIPTPYMSVHHN
ncbi:cytochrome P450 71D10-like protein [Tanacetum coccineum]